MRVILWVAKDLLDVWRSVWARKNVVVNTKRKVHIVNDVQLQRDSNVKLKGEMLK
jgi:hypothetical protein